MFAPLGWRLFSFLETDFLVCSWNHHLWRQLCSPNCFSLNVFYSAIVDFSNLCCFLYLRSILSTASWPLFCSCCHIVRFDFKILWLWCYNYFKYYLFLFYVLVNHNPPGGFVCSLGVGGLKISYRFFLCDWNFFLNFFILKVLIFIAFLENGFSQLSFRFV